MEMYIWKRSDVISIYRMKIWKSADITYQGNETYAFLMSDKYIMALYTHCLVARKEVAVQGVQIDGFTEKEHGMVRVENIGEVLFQALLLDSVRLNNAKMYAEFCTIYFLQ